MPVRTDSGGGGRGRETRKGGVQLAFVLAISYQLDS